MAQADATTSSLDPLDSVHWASNCRRRHYELRASRTRKLGGQSDNAVIPNPSRDRLVAAETRGCRARGCRGAANAATLANRIRCMVLHHHSIGQFSLPLTASCLEVRRVRHGCLVSLPAFSKFLG